MYVCVCIHTYILYRRVIFYWWPWHSWRPKIFKGITRLAKGRDRKRERSGRWSWTFNDFFFLFQWDQISSLDLTKKFHSTRFLVIIVASILLDPLQVFSFIFFFSYFFFFFNYFISFLFLLSQTTFILRSIVTVSLAENNPSESSSISGFPL